MRLLEFFVQEQELRKDETCDFSGIIKGTAGYLKAKFTFGNGWEDCGKIAVFATEKDNEYPVEIKNNECEIPEDVLKNRIIILSVIGIKKGYRICTNKVRVVQYG